MNDNGHKIEKPVWIGRVVGRVEQAQFQWKNNSV
jgi:hypothetical protein